MSRISPIDFKPELVSLMKSVLEQASAHIDTSSGKPATPAIKVRMASRILATAAAAHVNPGGRGAYLVAVGVERTEKARFIGLQPRLHPCQRRLVDEERRLDRAVISPEPHGVPGDVVRAAMVWKIDHCDVHPVA